MFKAESGYRNKMKRKKKREGKKRDLFICLGKQQKHFKHCSLVTL